MKTHPIPLHSKVLLPDSINGPKNGSITIEVVAPWYLQIHAKVSTWKRWSQTRPSKVPRNSHHAHHTCSSSASSSQAHTHFSKMACNMEHVSQKRSWHTQNQLFLNHSPYGSQLQISFWNGLQCKDSSNAAKNIAGLLMSNAEVDKVAVPSI